MAKYFGEYKEAFLDPYGGRPGLLLMAPLDFDGDGLLDLYITYGYVNPDEDIPVASKILLNNGDGTFRDGTAAIIDGAAPEGVRGAPMLGDFNGDGKLDIFVSDSGYDEPPHPGYQPQLLLSSETGWVDATETHLPQGPHNGVSAAKADIDADGDLDIFIGNIDARDDGSLNCPYFLINDGKGVFSEETDRIPEEFGNLNNNRFSSEVFADFDDDGHIDLFLGGFTENESFVLKNDGSGNFTLPDQSIPGKPIGSESFAIASYAFDFDSDGLPDVLCAYADVSLGYTRNAYKVYINKGSFEFEDKTGDYMPEIEIEDGDGWFGDAFFFRDMNFDGYVDLTTNINGAEAQLLLNDGTNHFYKPKNFEIGGGNHVIADFTGDGLPDVVAMGHGALYFRAFANGAITAEGGSGNNLFKGTDGFDGIDGKGGFDTLSYSDLPEGAPKVGIKVRADDRAGAGHVVDPWASPDRYINVERIVGSDFADTFIGGSAGDIFDGGAGADDMRGRAGNDTYYVDDPGDVVNEALKGAGANDAVLASISFSLSDADHARGEIERLTLTGSGKLNATGSDSADVLTGNSGNNTLTGRGGKDILSGKDGADDFRYKSRSEGGDTIKGFVSGSDDLVFKKSAFGDLSSVVEGATYVENTSGKAEDRNDRFILDKDTGILRFDLDGSRTNHDAVVIADLNLNNLSAGDFVFF